MTKIGVFCPRGVKKIQIFFYFWATLMLNFEKLKKRYESAFFFSLKYSTRSFISGVKRFSVIISSKVTAFQNFAKKWQKITKICVFCPLGAKKFEYLHFFIFSCFFMVFTFLQIFGAIQSFLAILEGGGSFLPPPRSLSIPEHPAANRVK